MTLSLRSDRRLLPVGTARRKLLVEIRAPLSAAAAKRPPLRLALVLDRSGSMAGPKLALTLQAAARSLQALGPEDRFSVVLYDESVTVLSPAVPATRAAVAEMIQAMRGVTAGGCTDLSAGWLSGCAQIGGASSDEGLARCLLLTDGLANRGITDREELLRHAAELRRRGVTTSTLGVGEDFDEVLLHQLAEAGGGHFYFAADESQISAHVSSETGSVLETVAREVILRVKARGGVRLESLNGDPSHTEDGSHRFELGSLCSGESIRRLITLDFPAGELGSEECVQVELSDADGALRKPAAAMSWLRAADADCEREHYDRDVELERARLEVALTRMRALDDQRRGNYEDAYNRLCKLADALQNEAQRDARIGELAREVTAEMSSYRTPTGKLIMKGRLYHNYLSLKSAQPAASVARGPAQPPKVFSCAVEREIAEPVDEAFRVLFAHARSWGIEAVLETLRPARRSGSSLDEVEEFTLVRSLSHAPHVTIAFIQTPHRDNWFSHWHPNERVALVSLHDWSSISSIACSAFAAYEMILHGLRAASYEYDPAQFMHYETRGCLFDFCAEKQDVEIKLQAGHICAACIARLNEIHVDPSAVGRVWSAVQQLAHPWPGARVGI